MFVFDSVSDINLGTGNASAGYCSLMIASCAKYLSFRTPSFILSASVFLLSHCSSVVIPANQGDMSPVASFVTCAAVLFAWISLNLAKRFVFKSLSGIVSI